MNTHKYNLSQANRLPAIFLHARGALLVVKNHLFELKDIRKGSRVSRLFRLIFEKKSVKTVLGSNIAILVLASSYLPISAGIGGPSSFEFDQAEEQIITQKIVQLKTEKNIQLPTEELVLNQSYSWYHRGIDLDGVTGDPIKSIMPGVVDKVQFSNVGYGNAVIIKHGDDLLSLYAHLSKIYVEPDQRITLDTIIGEMGSTGRSTGDHLHLEVKSGDTQINPLTLLR